MSSKTGCVPDQRPTPAFDAYAGQYDEALGSGLKLTGETKDYFVRGRAKALAERLVVLGFAAQSMLDFGCGCGDSCRAFFSELSVSDYVGVDLSVESLMIANDRYGDANCRFVPYEEHSCPGPCDLAYCNGVFHHIPPNERPNALHYIRHCLRPGGLFSFWENNPWNPGTRYVMKRIPFDRDALLISARAAKILLQRARFEVLSTDFHFIFPRQLRWLRGIEPFCAGIPFGGQYQIVARRR